MICPSCHGAKTQEVMVCFRSKYGGCERRIEKCDTCQGTGEITEQQKRQIERGRILRHFRVHEKKETQREFAAKYHMDFALLSKMEAGRVPMPEELWETIEKEALP